MALGLAGPLPSRFGSGGPRGAGHPLEPRRAAASEELKEPILEFGLVIATQRLITDLPGDLRKPPLQPGAAFRRAKVYVFGFPDPNHIGERPRPRQKQRNRLAATGTHKIVRVLPLGQKREAE